MWWYAFGEIVTVIGCSCVEGECVDLTGGSRCFRYARRLRRLFPCGAGAGTATVMAV